MGNPTICILESCDRGDIKGRGLCRMHYHRAFLDGELDNYPLLGRRRKTGEERLRTIGWDVRQVVPGMSPCWEWRGGKYRHGYGLVATGEKLGPKRTGAHRLAYKVWVGQLGDDEIIRHKCDNPPCMNPDHLVPGGYLENTRDMMERKRYKNGERSHMCRLTDKQVAEIRAKYIPYVYTQEMLAREYGVNRTTISGIVRWRSRVEPTLPVPVNHTDYSR